MAGVELEGAAELERTPVGDDARFFGAAVGSCLGAETETSPVSKGTG